ncbi:MAG TPA: beta-ketoacyl-ACP synthase III [Candidatus Paceibacterota bacterium]|nr:beta-ketoacyl-ACP synthase III [Candidatus Paceibacterota bacterium]HSA00894.1 beta-ketoacyl-ACP synthase III [Candidatus Paceibacterota bacterium]
MKTEKSQTFVNPRILGGNATRTCSIAGVGSYVPDRVLSNIELEKIVDTSDTWITTRTGIKERRMAGPEQYTSDLAAEAARRAMAHAGITPDQIDLIIVATITPDTPFPSTACWLQHKIGAHRAAAFDVEAACSGFLYGLEIGQQFVMTQTYNTVLVIGAEKLSSIIDWKDRNTCVLFGDGAGAVILRNRPQSHGLLTVCMGADGSKTGLLGMPGGGSRCPASHESVDERLHFLRMDGKETFKHAVTAMCNAAREALHRCHIEIGQVACIIPHQANRRIIDAVTERLHARADQVFVNLEKYGNTSAASVAIALDEAVRAGRIHRGDLVLMVAFGAGFTWASAVIEW